MPKRRTVAGQAVIESVGDLPNKNDGGHRDSDILAELQNRGALLPDQSSLSKWRLLSGADIRVHAEECLEVDRHLPRAICLGNGSNVTFVIRNPPASKPLILVGPGRSGSLARGSQAYDFQH